MLKRVFGGTLLSALVAFSLAACGDDPTAPGGTGDLAITLGPMDGSASAAVSEWAPRLSEVELTSVESIMVTVDRVQVHRVGTEDEGADGDAGGWIDLTLTTAAEMDLMDLTTAPSPVEVAEAEGIAAGDYDGVRFFFTGISITFSSDQQVDGSGETISAGTAVDLTVPSGDQSGIKVPGASFSITDGGATTFDVSWDANTSVQNITITGTNEVIMAPVLVGDGDGSV